MAEVTFIGTGEAFDPDLPNTSVLYRGALTLLVDCGYGVPQAFWRVTRDASLLDAIYLTHRHADHSFGLPSLLLWMREEGRTRPLEIIGGPGTEAWLREVCELAYPRAFQNMFPLVSVDLAPGERLVRGGATLENAESAHSVRNLALRIDEDGRSYCHSGDGRPTDATRALYTGANVVVHECYFAERETKSHAHMGELFQMAEEVAIESLVLLHFGRYEKARVRELCAARDPEAPRVVIPEPGDTLSV